MAERAVLGAQDELGADDVRRQPLLRRPDVVVAAAAGDVLHLPRLHVPVPRLRLRLRPPLLLLRVWAGILVILKKHCTFLLILVRPRGYVKLPV